MDNEVIIFKDVEGNYDINCYYRAEDLEDLKEFLRKRGVSKIEVCDDEESIAKKRPFIDNKPLVMRKKTRRINWLKPEVIVELLCSRVEDDYEKTKKLCELSGFSIDDLQECEKPSGFISPSYSEKSKAYEKWKRENKIVETPETKKELVGRFALDYIAECLRLRQKRVQPGTKVYVSAEGKNAVVTDYDEDSGEYNLKDEEGFEQYYPRREFEVEE